MSATFDCFIGLGAGAIPPASFPCMEGRLSVQAISWVLDNSKSRGLSRLVLIAIANHADKFGREAFPANKTIAQEAGVSEREVRYCIAELSNLGEVKVEYKASKYGTNVYALAKMHPAQFATSTRQALGKECQETRHALAPEPSLTVKREECAPSALGDIPFQERIQTVSQRLDDYYKRRWQTDEQGKRFLISPSSGERVYEGAL